jgi:hypothetical protein
MIGGSPLLVSRRFEEYDIFPRKCAGSVPETTPEAAEFRFREALGSVRFVIFLVRPTSTGVHFGGCGTGNASGE